MEQFNLDKWLKNKSRKVVTRDGRNVFLSIQLCPNEYYTVMGMVEGDKDVETWTNEGINVIAVKSAYDLFFADEEEELTELQKTLEEDCDCYVNLYNDGKTREELREWIKCWCHRIIDLARKEIEKSIEDGAIEFAKSYMEDANPSFEKVQESEELWKWKMSCLKGVNKAYTNGKQDALKDLPKWKKTTDSTRKPRPFLGIGAYELYDGKGFYIELDELEKLPKEE